MKKVIQCDDRIQVIAEKTWTDGSGRKLPLADYWRGEVIHARERDTGECIIYSYWNGQKKGAAYLSPEGYRGLADEEKRKWVPCFEWIVPTGIQGTQGRTRGNHVTFQVYGLSKSDDARLLASRYKTMVNVLHAVRPEFIEYKPRGGNERAFRESSRNILIRNFRMHEYEYDIMILDDRLGHELYSELAGCAEHQYGVDGTLYLKGYSKDHKKTGGASIKLYDAGKKDGGESLMKVEVTLRAKAFDKVGVTIQNMTFQEDCIALLRGAIMVELASVKNTGKAYQEMCGELFREDNVLARIVRLEKVQERQGTEQMTMKEQIKAMKRAIEELQQKVQ